ncbi:MAG: PAS domain S-box protein [Armatimonadetes bacterium]|nr:PAS domain S-box protein [Armatimonadota bacterium]
MHARLTLPVRFAILGVTVTAALAYLFGLILSRYVAEGPDAFAASLPPGIRIGDVRTLVWIGAFLSFGILFSTLYALVSVASSQSMAALRAQEALLRLSRTLQGLQEPEAIVPASFAAIREHLRPEAIARPGSRATSDDNLFFLSLVANQTAIALERAQARQATSQAEGRFRTLFEGVPVGLYRATPEGKILDANPAMVQMLGYPDRETLLQTDLSTLYVHPEEGRGLVSRLEREDTVRNLDIQLHRYDGIRIWVRQSARAARNGAGRIEYFEGVSEDITERLKAEEQLRKLSQAVEQSASIVVITDTEENIEYVNPRFTEVTGYAPEGMVGAKATRLGEFAPGDYQRVRERLAAGEVWKGEIHAFKKNGERYWEMAAISPLRDADGHATHYIKVGEDITERKRAEEHLNLLTDLRHRLLQVGERLNRRLSMAEVLEAIGEGAMALTGASRAAVYTVTGDRTVLCPWFSGLSPQHVADILSHVREMPGSRLLRGSTDPVLTPDVLDLPEDSLLRQIASADGIRAGTLWPIIYEAHPIAAVGCYFEAPHHVHDAEREVMLTFARQAAVAMENARLYEESRRETVRAEALARVAARLNAELDLDAVLVAVCEETARALNVPAAAVRLYDSVRDALVYAGAHGLPADFWRYVRSSPRTLYDRLMREQGALIVAPDVRAIADVPNAGLYAAIDARTVVTAVMQREDTLVGGLVIFSFEQVRHFSEEELTLLRGLDDQAAQAITNARLFEQVRAGRERLEVLSRRLVEVQEDERRGIARELHDEIGQALTAVKIDLQTAQKVAGAPALAARLADSIGTVELTLQRVRDLSLDLRPPLLDDLGLIAALRWYVDRQARRAGLTVYFSSAPAELEEMRLAPDLETTCFRVVQEAITNVMRHARARHVWVELRREDDALHLAVRDDGVGFDVEAARSRAARGGSMGILGIQERVLLVGGEVAIESAPARGTEIRARMPTSTSAVPGIK